MEESDDDEVMVSSVGEDTISVYNKRKKVSAWQKNNHLSLEPLPLLSLLNEVLGMIYLFCSDNDRMADQSDNDEIHGSLQNIISTEVNKNPRMNVKL